MGVAPRIRPLTLDTITHLPDTAACDHWRRDLVARGLRPVPPEPVGTVREPKAVGSQRPDRRPDRVVGWAEDVAAEWGHCGMVAAHDGVTIGYLALAPAHLMPQIGPYANSPVGPDAAVVLAVHVVDGWTRRGIGRQLVQAVAADLTRRDVAALEAVGSPIDAPYTLPEGWLDAVGFRLVRDHPLMPRYRLDLSSTLRWRPHLYAAWHRVRGLVSHPAPPEPAGFADRLQQRRRTEVVAPVTRTPESGAAVREPSRGLR